MEEERLCVNDKLLKSDVEETVIKLSNALNNESAIGRLKINDSNIREQRRVGNVHVVGINLSLEVLDGDSHLIVVHQVHQLHGWVQRKLLEFKVSQVEGH